MAVDLCKLDKMAIEAAVRCTGWQQAVVRSLAALEAQRKAAATDQLGAIAQGAASATLSRALGAIAQATASTIL